MTRARGARFLTVGLASAGVLLAGCGGDGGGTGPDNQSPSVSISSPSDGATFVEGKLITFEGSASDPEQGTLAGNALTWESDLDGELGAGRSLSRGDLSVGDHVVTLTASDREEARGSATVSITVQPNQAPSASISSPPDDTTFGQGAPVDFEGTGDDPDEGSLTGASLEWSSDLDGALGTGASLTVADLSVGEHVVTLTASDPQGATGTDSVSLTVESNGQPSPTIASPSDGATFQEGESVDFQGAATDPEDGDLTGGSLVWTSDADGQIGTGETFARDDLSSGDHTITLEATDSRNASTTTTVEITVEGDPVVTISSPADSSIFDEGTAVSFEGSADDPGDGPLTGGSLVWSSDADGELGTGGSLTESGLSPGPHTIALTATDSDGNQGAASIELVVEEPGFDIRIRELSNLSSSERADVEQALAPWEAAITGDLEGGFLPPQDTTTADGDPEFPDDVNECLADTGGGVDDLLICVFVVDIDGSDGTLAQAGPVFLRTGNGLPVLGRVFIDQADRSNPQLREIVTHEIGHVLGIGIGPVGDWGTNTRDLNTNDPWFGGVETNSAFDGLGGEAYLSDGVPLANSGGGGTQGAHWREDNFQQELMTGFLDGGVDNPLSRVSLAALADIGYEVDQDRADSYTLPMPQTALWEAEADATLSSGSPDTNFGLPGTSILDDTLVVGTNNRPWTSAPDTARFASLLRFGERPIPAGVTLTDAALELRRTERIGDTMDHDVDAKQVTGSWSEDGVTWNTRPGVGSASLDTLSQGSCGLCAFRSAALVDLVRDWADGSTPNHGLYLEDPDVGADSTFSIGFWTRHAPPGPLGLVVRIPQLRVFGETGGAPVRALRAPPGVEKIPLGDDVLPGPLLILEPDGSVRRIRPERGPGER
jgi:hypothetical protein